MDEFDDIAAIASDTHFPVSIEEAVDAYDKEGVTRLINLWKQFAVKLPPSVREVEMKTPFQSEIRIPWVRAYMAWRVKFGQGRISNKITVTTLLKEFQQIQRTLRLAKQFEWSNRDQAVIKKYIRDLPKTAGASTAMRPKSVAYALDADEIQFYLWNCCERVYSHPRMMIQFSFWLHLMAVWGLRTGEVTESSSHRGSNEGVHYGDVNFSLVARERQPQYQIKIALRNRKFSRDNDSRVKIVTLNEHMDPKERFKCPVRKFLALALADNVFEQQFSPESLDKRWVPPTAGSRTFKIREDKQNLPILRKVLPGGTISDTRIMSAMSTNTFLKEICEQCGYTEPVTTYTFRRGVANKLEANASSKSTKEALGHKGDRTWHAYAAPTIGVDAQAIAYDEPQDTAHVEYCQSIAITRDFAAPKPPRAIMGILPIPSKEILDATIAAHPKSRPEMIMRKARQIQHKANMAKYAERAGIMMVPGMENSLPPRKDSSSLDIDVNLRPEPTRRFKQMLKYNLLQARVIETLWTADDASVGDCVRPLMTLANPQAFRPFYPDPVKRPRGDGKCPYCQTDICGLRHSRLASHLLDCHCSTHQVHFCYHCAIFIPHDEEKNHQCSDLDENRQDYGVVTWRGLVISEGRCPFGACGSRDKRWRNPDTLKSHVESHLESMPEGNQLCPIAGCGYSGVSKDEIRVHFHDIHHVHMVSGRLVISGHITLPNLP